MVKYKVTYKNSENVNIEKTFEKAKLALKHLEMGLCFGIKEMKIEQFRITENEQKRM